jgi:hypothetical protein
MKQLDLFEKEMNWPNDFDGAHQVGSVGSASSPGMAGNGTSHPLYGAVPPETKKIYESPDKGQTIYERDFGASTYTRKMIQSPVKTSVQQQWDITYKTDV